MKTQPWLVLVVILLTVLATTPPALTGAALAADSFASTITPVGQLPGTFNQVQVVSPRAYTAGTVGLSVIDVTNPISPTLLGQYATTIRDFHVVGSRAYVAAGNSGMPILDLGGPLSPTLLSSFMPPLPDPGAFSQVLTAIRVSGQAAYLDEETFGIGLPPFRAWRRILDLTNPISPTVRLTQSAGFGSVDMEIAHGRLTTGGSSGISGATGTTFYYPFLSQHDLADPLSPTLRASYFDSSAISTSPGPAAVATTDTSAYLSTPQGLRVINLSNPLTPTAVFTYTAVPLDITIAAGLAYLALGEQGVQVLSLNTPLSPTLVASHDTPGSAQGIDVAGDLIYVADGTGGLQILRLTERTAAAISNKGGTLVSPGGQVSAQFAAGTFSSTTTISLTMLAESDTPNAGELARVGSAFELSSTAQLRAPLTLTRPYTLQVSYTPGGFVLSETLALYRWDGTRWLKESGSTVDVAHTVVRAKPERLGIFALLGETRRVLLPTLLY